MTFGSHDVQSARRFEAAEGSAHLRESRVQFGFKAVSACAVVFGAVDAAFCCDDVIFADQRADALWIDHAFFEFDVRTAAGHVRGDCDVSFE